MRSASPRINILIISLAIFMEFLDTSILNTAIPSISLAFHIHPIDLKTALISYLMSLAIIIPISGWLCDYFGLKKLFMIATLVFTITSLCCGFSQNIYQLIVFRFLQGLGGALNFPIARMIIFKTFPKHEYIKKMNVVMMLASIAVVMGPLIGGLIVEHFSWRWIFWLNIPIGCLNLLLMQNYLPRYPTHRPYKLDKIGLLFFAFALSSFLFFISLLSDFELHFAYSNQIFLFSVICFLLYFIHSRKQRHPIIDLKLFQNKTFSIGIITGSISRLALNGFPFLLPIFFQIHLHKSPSLSGFLILFWALGAIISRVFNVSILEFLGFKKSLIINTFFVSAIILSFRYLNLDSPIWMIAGIVLFSGIFSTIQSTYVNAMTFDHVDETNFALSTSLFSTIQQVGMCLGIALCAIFLSVYSEQEVLTAMTFVKTFSSLAIIPLFNLMIFFRLDEQTGESLIKR